MVELRLNGYNIKLLKNNDRQKSVQCNFLVSLYRKCYDVDNVLTV